jgi:glucokinase
MTDTASDHLVVLIGDIGGTHCRLALVEHDQILAQETYSSQDYPHLKIPVLAFLKKCKDDHHKATQEVTKDLTPKVACFGVAGPVHQGRVHLTNLGWTLEETELSEQIGCPVRLVNDFYAQAVAIPYLDRYSLVHLCGPDSQDTHQRPIAVLGAGTGLGEALLIPSPNQGYIAVATEGGHTRFAPKNEIEIGLLRWLQGRYGDHISVERVVSGPGLVDLYRYLLGSRSPCALLEEPITGAMISRLALEHADETCERSLEIFISIYADEAANLALKCNAQAVYLSGGITPQILTSLRRYFHHIFVDKGRYRQWLADVSVWVVAAPEPGLMGAQIEAENLAKQLKIK